VTDTTKGNPLDLRVWLDEVRQLGELTEVLGADWNLELGAISELNVKKTLPPALLFDNIDGYPDGFRVMTCSTSSPARLSSILRVGVEKSHRGLVDKLRGTRTFSRAMTSICSRSRHPCGMRRMVDATSAPVAWSSPRIWIHRGSMSALIA